MKCKCPDILQSAGHALHRVPIDCLTEDWEIHMRVMEHIRDYPEESEGFKASKYYNPQKTKQYLNDRIKECEDAIAVGDGDEWRHQNDEYLEEIISECKELLKFVNKQ